jgi:hypothetical protein
MFACCFGPPFRKRALFGVGKEEPFVCGRHIIDLSAATETFSAWTPIQTPHLGTCFTEENMGMPKDYELTASFLAGGLGGTRLRFDRTMGRVRSCRPKDAHDCLDILQSDSRSPSYAAAVSQAMSDLIDAWQGLQARPIRFQKTEKLFLQLKDKTLESLAPHRAVWSDFYRLAQCLNELKLDRGPEKPSLWL